MALPLQDGTDNVVDRAAIVFFDGVCNLCNAGVTFIIDRDPDGYFQFAPLQSDVATALLAPYGVSTDAMDSFILLEEGRVYQRSDAALRIARRFQGAWRLLSVVGLLPRPVRDALYDVVARNRYRWFGRRDACRLPTPELQARFLP